MRKRRCAGSAYDPPVVVEIREKTAADAAACLELLTRVHRADGYPMRLGPDFLTAGNGQEAGAWVAESDGVIVGHVALRTSPESPTLHVAARATRLPVDQLALVARLFVDPQQRRTGLGRRLLRHAAAEAPKIGRRAVLDVGQRLGPAVALYESEGWERVGELHEPLDAETVLDLWVYISPEPPVRIIDGAAFDDFDGFVREFNRLLCHHTWNGNLDAFNDILRGGFGTPETTWTLRWADAERSRRVLGHPAMARWLQRNLQSCHPTNRAGVEARLRAAQRGEGETLFGLIVEIIREHAPDGDETGYRIVLELA
jgi:GNAT superfamily N-acetyltransferase